MNERLYFHKSFLIAIYLSTYFFNRYVDSTYIPEKDLIRIITNASITLEYDNSFAGRSKQAYHLGLLLTRQERKWLVSEINNNLN